MWFSWNEHARTIYTHIHLYKNNDILTVKAWKKTFTLTFVIWTQIKIWSNTTFYVQLYGLYCGLVMTYIATQIWVNTGSGNGLLPDGSKPLPEPMMTSPQWCPMAFKWEQFPWCFRNQFTAWIIKLLPHFPGASKFIVKRYWIICWYPRRHISNVCFIGIWLAIEVWCRMYVSVSWEIIKFA